jgi:hypothetical protein
MWAGQEAGSVNEKLESQAKLNEKPALTEAQEIITRG